MVRADLCPPVSYVPTAAPRLPLAGRSVPRWPATALFGTNRSQTRLPPIGADPSTQCSVNSLPPANSSSSTPRLSSHRRPGSSWSPPRVRRWKSLPRCSHRWVSSCSVSKAESIRWYRRQVRVFRARKATTAVADPRDEAIVDIVVTASRYTLAADLARGPHIPLAARSGRDATVRGRALKAVHRLPGAASNGLAGLAHMRGGDKNETQVISTGCRSTSRST